MSNITKILNKLQKLLVVGTVTAQIVHDAIDPNTCNKCDAVKFCWKIGDTKYCVSILQLPDTDNVDGFVKDLFLLICYQRNLQDSHTL